MKYGRYVIAAFLIFPAILLVSPPETFSAADAPRITGEEVRALLNDPSLLILDARTDSEWKRTERKITGAVRIDPYDVKSRAVTIPREKKIVVYCS